MIELKTEEQRTEMIARCVYLLSGLRFLQREHQEMFAWQGHDPELKMWEARTDEFLKNIGAVEFKTLKELISECKIK